MQSDVLRARARTKRDARVTRANLPTRIYRRPERRPRLASQSNMPTAALRATRRISRDFSLPRSLAIARIKYTCPFGVARSHDTTHEFVHSRNVGLGGRRSYLLRERDVGVSRDDANEETLFKESVKDRGGEGEGGRTLKAANLMVARAGRADDASIDH